MTDANVAELAQPTDRSTDDERLAHLVLKPDWPIALCGATVLDHLGDAAPARDRCPQCLSIARDRKLGRPAWREVS